MAIMTMAMTATIQPTSYDETGVIVDGIEDALQLESNRWKVSMIY